MDELYCGPARQVHFNRAVAEYGGWFIQDLHDITGDVSTRGMSGVGWHSGIKPAMERIRMVADAMLAFDDEYAELLEARWQSKSEAPTVNPYCEERADLVLTFLSGDGSGIASAFKGNCRVITAKAEYLKPLADQVLDEERYRVRREYGRRRALFEARTARPPVTRIAGPDARAHADGPEEPDQFWFNNHPHEISGRKFQLLRALWRQRKISIEDLIDDVWLGSDVSDRTVKNAASELGIWFDEQTLPFLCNTKSGYVLLSNAPPGK